MKLALPLACVLVAASAACVLDYSKELEPIALSYPYTPSDDAVSDGLRQVAERVSNAYVRVLIYGHSEDEGMLRNIIVSGASGTIADNHGYVITAAHVARDTRYCARITTMDGRTHDGIIVDVDPTRELALLKIDPFPGMQVASVGDSSQLLPGQQVFSIGTPNHRMGIVSLGRIAIVKRENRIELNEFSFDKGIKLEMEVEPGHSGGPLFDAAGQFIGMAVGFGLGDTRQVPYVSTRIAYAVPSVNIIEYLSDKLTSPQTAYAERNCHVNKAP